MIHETEKVRNFGYEDEIHIKYILRISYFRWILKDQSKNKLESQKE